MSSKNYSNGCKLYKKTCIVTKILKLGVIIKSNRIKWDISTNIWQTASVLTFHEVKTTSGSALQKRNRLHLNAEF